MTGEDEGPSEEELRREGERRRLAEEAEEHEFEKEVDRLAQFQDLRAQYLDGSENYDLNDSVRIRINDQVKQFWEAAVMQSDYSSISHLVRVSVEKELSGRYDSQESQNQQVLEAVLAVQDELEEANREIQRTRRDIVNEDKLSEVIEGALDSVSGDNDG